MEGAKETASPATRRGVLDSFVTRFFGVRPLTPSKHQYGFYAMEQWRYDPRYVPKLKYVFPGLTSGFGLFVAYVVLEKMFYTPLPKTRIGNHGDHHGDHQAPKAHH